MLDIHTHNPNPDPEAVIDISAEVRNAVEAGEFNPEAFASEIFSRYSPDQKFSVGVHPWWSSSALPDELFAAVGAIAAMPQCALIGEAGIDTLKGGPMFRQILYFNKMAQLAADLSKPLIIHDVKAHDMIVPLAADYPNSDRWIIHGFRYKPSVAKMMLDKGFRLSFGPNFNPETLLSIPLDSILAETDDSGVNIENVINALSEARGEDLLSVIRTNTTAALTQTV